MITQPLRPSLLALAGVLALAACDKPKPRVIPPPPPQAAPPPDAAPAVALPPAPGAHTAGLAKEEEPPGFYVDQVGQAVDPVNKLPAVTPAAAPLVIAGFAFDDVAKAPAKGVDVVVDGVAYPAIYGQARKDVAAYFKNPALTDVGFSATLPPGTLAAGEHRVAIRAVAADGSGYFESPEVAFTLR